MNIGLYVFTFFFNFRVRRKHGLILILQIANIFLQSNWRRCVFYVDFFGLWPFCFTTLNVCGKKVSQILFQTISSRTRSLTTVLMRRKFQSFIKILPRKFLCCIHRLDNLITLVKYAGSLAAIFHFLARTSSAKFGIVTQPVQRLRYELQRCLHWNQIWIASPIREPDCRLEK